MLDSGRTAPGLESVEAALLYSLQVQQRPVRIRRSSQLGKMGEFYVPGGILESD
jgi:hypothetical protein